MLLDILEHEATTKQSCILSLACQLPISRILQCAPGVHFRCQVNKDGFLHHGKQALLSARRSVGGRLVASEVRSSDPAGGHRVTYSRLCCVRLATYARQRILVGVPPEAQAIHLCEHGHGGGRTNQQNQPSHSRFQSSLTYPERFYLIVRTDGLWNGGGELCRQPLKLCLTRVSMRVRRPAVPGSMRAVSPSIGGMEAV